MIAIDYLQSRHKEKGLQTRRRNPLPQSQTLYAVPADTKPGERAAQHEKQP